MSPLNIHPEEVAPVSKKKNGNKTLKVFLGIGVLIAIPVIGTTFAATIGINGGGANTVQFAQGSIATAACDDEITTQATSEFSTTFKLKTIVLGGVDLSTCKGKTITVSVATGNSEATLITSGTVKQLSFKIPATVSGTLEATDLSPATGFAATIKAANGGDLTALTDTEAKLTITISTLLLDSSAVDKILVQSS
jgi:hypothetical protein